MIFSYNEQFACYRTRANWYMRLADARHPAVEHHAECWHHIAMEEWQFLLMPDTRGAVVPAPWPPWLPYKLPQPRASQPSRLLPGLYLVVGCMQGAEFGSSSNRCYSQLLRYLLAKDSSE